MWEDDISPYYAILEYPDFFVVSCAQSFLLVDDSDFSSIPFLFGRVVLSHLNLNHVATLDGLFQVSFLFFAKFLFYAVSAAFDLHYFPLISDSPGSSINFPANPHIHSLGRSQLNKCSCKWKREKKMATISKHVNMQIFLKLKEW